AATVGLRVSGAAAVVDPPTPLGRPCGLMRSRPTFAPLVRRRRRTPAMTTDGHLTLLSAKGISKRFGGVHALSDVDFSIGHGEIYGLIGPNGAGKTSLFNVLTGIYEQDEGEFMFDGQPLTGLKPNDVAERGIARTFQNIRL